MYKKKKVLISCVVTVQLICTLVFSYAKGSFSLDPVCFFLVWLLYEQYGF